MADEFLHVATHAPQPIHVAASNASSASSLLIGIELASWVLPDVLTEIYPPDCCILSKAVLSTTKSLITGNALALKGSINIVSPDNQGNTSWM